MGCFSAEEGEVPLEGSHFHSCAWIGVYLFRVVGDRLVGRLVLNQYALQEAFEIDVVIDGATCVQVKYIWNGHKSLRDRRSRTEFIQREK
jgi:hypothetical protein